MKDTLFSSHFTVNAQGILHAFTEPIVMGIINITPDSFYSDSRTNSIDEGLAKGNQLIKDGATILDIGGYSSRPGADAVTEKEEIERIQPIIESIKAAHPNTLISIDTFRSQVAKAALEAGANIINDISGGQIDDRIYSIAADFQAPYILMHMRGTPQTMQQYCEYKHLSQELLYYFSERVNLAREAGVKDIILDPGFGFSKTIEQNYELLHHFDEFHALELPILIGISRKSMIYKTLKTSPEQSLNGTSVLNTLALENGAHILRVHDVKEAVEVIKLHTQYKKAATH